MRQAELARQAAIPRSVLSAYESRTRDPRAASFIKALEAAGFALCLRPVPTPAQDREAARVLLQVLELAEALPYKPPGLRFPTFRTRIA